MEPDLYSPWIEIEMKWIGILPDIWSNIAWQMQISSTRIVFCLCVCVFIFSYNTNIRIFCLLVYDTGMWETNIY